MKNAAIDLAQKKIRCNAVLPGMIETPLKAGKSLITEEQWEANRQLYPLKRFGIPEDVAYGIIYLLSDASSWVTGTELVIDGGRKLK
jgi:NAD(P)-dependent dehydrogenase (short-subunit alcohol dehydrogenase family)